MPSAACSSEIGGFLTSCSYPVSRVQISDFHVWMDLKEEIERRVSTCLGGQNKFINILVPQGTFPASTAFSFCFSKSDAGAFVRTYPERLKTNAFRFIVNFVYSQPWSPSPPDTIHAPTGRQRCESPHLLRSRYCFRIVHRGN